MASKYNKTLIYPRPFLMYWDHLASLELKRKQGAFSGNGFLMIKQFVKDIGVKNFIDEFLKTTATCEIAKFYEVQING